MLLKTQAKLAFRRASCYIRSAGSGGIGDSDVSTRKTRYGIGFLPSDKIEIANMDDPSAEPIVMSGESARRLNAAFTDAADARGYGFEEINPIQHWLLKRAHEEASRATR